MGLILPGGGFCLPVLDQNQHGCMGGLFQGVIPDGKQERFSPVDQATQQAGSYNHSRLSLSGRQSEDKRQADESHQSKNDKRRFQPEKISRQADDHHHGRSGQK